MDANFPVVDLSGTSYQTPTDVPQDVPQADPSAYQIPVNYPTDYGIKFVAPAPPEVKLATKLAAATAQAQQVKRQIDSATMPVINQDLVDAVNHKDEIAKQIEQTRLQLQQRVPHFVPGQLQTPDLIAQGLAMLIGGAKGGNQAYAALQGRQDALAKQNYTEAQQQFDLNRENTISKLKELGADADNAERIYNSLQGEKINTLQAQDQAGYAQDLQRLRDQGDLAQEQLKQTALDKREALRIDARRQTQEYKSQMQIIRDHIKAAYNLADPTQRFAALQDLNAAASSGRLEPAMRDDLAKELAGESYTGQVRTSTVAKNNSTTSLNATRQADIEATRPARIAALKAATGVNDQRASYIATQLSWYDAKSSAEIAKSYAIIDNYKNLIQDRGLKTAQAAVKGNASVLGAVTKSLNGLTYTAQGLRKANADIQNNIVAQGWLPKSAEYIQAQAQIEENNKKIADAQAAYKDLQDNSKELRNAVGKSQTPTSNSSSGAGVNLDLERSNALAALRLAKTPADKARIKAHYKSVTGKDIYGN